MKQKIIGPALWAILGVILSINGLTFYTLGFWGVLSVVFAIQVNEALKYSKLNK
jgi:hypothetical protein